MEQEPRTGICRFLNRMASQGLGKEVWVVRKTEEKRGFFHDLENGMLERGRVGVGERV